METLVQESTQTVSLERLHRMADCKSNLVGIPRPGRYAFTLRRDTLAKLIDGLDDENADATLTKDRLIVESITRRYAIKDAFEWDGGLNCYSIKHYPSKAESK